VYDAAQSELRAEFQTAAPLLDCCFSDNTHAFSGGLDCAVKM
jgi:cell cycle arrest protein BUB3